MKNLVRFTLLLIACAVFLQSGWVSYSQENKCPEMPQSTETGKLDKSEFLAAHGIPQEQFSIWLKEHSVWRNKFSEDLKQFTFIPQDYDTGRQ